MTETTTLFNPQQSPYPPSVGYTETKPTLCIGLDFAWFGGSKKDPRSQFDFLAAALVGGDTGKDRELHHFERVPLASKDQADHRDPRAFRTAKALEKILQLFHGSFERIVIAVDAPLQAIERGLPERQPNRKKGETEKIALRACERFLNYQRHRIDIECGGSNGWHPKVQAGAPLAPRVTHFLEAIEKRRRIVPWTGDKAQSDNLVVECFPAEAIWAAKRLNQIPKGLTASCVKIYKKQARCHLKAAQVRKIITTTLRDGYKQTCGAPSLWPQLVEAVISWMLKDKEWQVNGLYRGGKMLDDVVDSMLCLATAMSYTFNNAHIWQDSGDCEDGHIIGPGRFGAECGLTEPIR